MASAEAAAAGGLAQDCCWWHNTAALVDAVAVDGSRGLTPQRVPSEVLSAMSPTGQARMRDSAGVEIRWVNERPAAPVHVTLSAPDPERPVEAIGYWGDFRGREVHRILPIPRRCVVQPFPRWHEFPVTRSGRMHGSFAPQVCRLVFSGGPVVLHGLEGGSLRRPRSDELPVRRALAYGTSITQGAVATGQHLSFVSLLARALQADVLNLGSGGSCHCEPEMADYLATLPYDYATCCLSVNMVRSFTVAEFRRRVDYLLRTMVGAHAGRPVIALSPLPWYDEWSGSATSSSTAAFRVALRDVADAIGPPVIYVDGLEALTDLAGLADDLLHPSDHGMIAIARVLEERLACLLPTVSANVSL